MEKRLVNKLSMNYSTREACERWESDLADFQAFSDAFQEFKAELSKIETVIRFQEMTTKGITQNKNTRKAAMAETTMSIANAVYCYACNVNDETLMFKVNVTSNEILYTPSPLSLQRSITIYDIAQEHIGNLSGYGISVATLNDFRTKIDAFERALVKPRAALTMRKAATLELKMLFKNTDRILKNKMDRMMKSLKPSHPQVYQEYFNARQIIDSGTRRIRKSESTTPVA